MKPMIWTVLSAALLLISFQTAAIPQGPKDLEAEARRKAEKDLAQKKYKELKEATAELAGLTRVLIDAVEGSSEHVISARVPETAEKIEKLARRIRDKAKGS